MTSLRIALAQVNPRVGDLTANADAIVDSATRAAALGARLVVLPELALIGYPPLDLLDEPEFVAAAHEARADVVARLGTAAPGVSVIFGAIGHAVQTPGKRLLNVAVLARDGIEIAAAPKSLLPSYDVFDEDRFFTPAAQASPIDVGGALLGLSVCEDIWNDELYWRHRVYARDPIAELARAGAQIIINISASPYHRGKPATREAMLSATAQRHGLPVVFVNQVGANDELIFDGTSALIAADGTVLARARSFAEDLVVCELSPDASPKPAPLVALAQDLPGSARELRQALVLGVADYVRKCGFSDVLIGLSGGIDSAIVAAIACEALGPRHVEGVLMPSRFTAEQSNGDALELAKNLGMPTRTIPIESLHDAFLADLAPHFEGKKPDTTEENIQARIRGVLLMALSNKHGKLVLSTGNKSELAVGYCTLYGDMTGGLAVLGDCYKGWVREIARDWNVEREVIPAAIIERPPTAELRADQRDEDDLPPYALLDAILHGLIEERKSIAELGAAGMPEDVVHRVRRLLDRNEYKRRQAAPILRVSTRAFGTGRRLPVARG